MDNFGRGRVRRFGALSKRAERGSLSTEDSAGKRTWNNLTRRTGHTYGGVRVSRPPGRRSGCFEPSPQGELGGPGPALGGWVGCSALLGGIDGSGHRNSRDLGEGSLVRVVAKKGRPPRSGDMSALPMIGRKGETISTLWRAVVLRSTARADATTRDCVWVRESKRKTSADHLFDEEVGGVQRKRSVAKVRPGMEGGNPRIAWPQRACPGLVRSGFTSSGQISMTLAGPDLRDENGALDQGPRRRSTCARITLEVNPNHYPTFKRNRTDTKWRVCLSVNERVLRTWYLCHHLSISPA